MAQDMAAIILSIAIYVGVAVFAGKQWEQKGGTFTKGFLLAALGAIVAVFLLQPRRRRRRRRALEGAP